MSLPPELAAAVADVRSNGSATDWCLCGYADGAELTLKMVGSGTGGADALAAQLTDDNVYYGLVRTYEQIDATRAVKFVFLSFVGEGVAAMKKAKISTLKGTITESFTPFHAEMLNASDPKEVTSAAVDALLGEMFGSAVDAPAGGAASIRIGMKEIKLNDTKKAEKSVMSKAQSVELPSDLAAAIADVRSNDSATDWCLCGYADGELNLKMVGSGTGGTDALAAQLRDDNVYYGLVRTYEQIDATRAVKFVFLSFVGEGVAAMKKAKISTLKGTITESFTPFHAELLNASDPKEVTAAAVDALVLSDRVGGGGAVGDARKGSQGAAEAASTAIGGRAGGQTAVRGYKSSVVAAGGVSLVAQAPAAPKAPEAVVAAVAAVRRDDDPAAWVLLGYEAAAKAPTLCVAATGRGGADELAAALDASQVMYGLLRLTQRIDSSTTVKFACVSWLGDAVPPMRRAKLSAVRGAALDAVSPYHTELLNVTSAADVTAAAIMAQLEEGKA